jgi:PEP-CTERM motif
MTDRSTPSRRRHPATPATLWPALFIVCGVAAHADDFGVVSTGLDIAATVTEAYNPGGIAFQDDHSVPGTLPDPKQSAEYLHLAPQMGENQSGRSRDIRSAFASALSESDGNGGAGVSNWSATDPQGPGQDSVGQLAAQASWGSIYTNNGPVSVVVSIHLQIPDLQVGLLGVSPDRDGVSAAESATASATIDSVITHADGSTGQGGSFLYGLKEYEVQVFLGPNHYSNYADVAYLRDDVNPASYNNDDYNPSWTLEPYATDVKLATLNPGDSVSFIYTLTAQGTTHGRERGFYAFLGDPFGVDIVGGNLSPIITLAVPEPGTWALMLLGIGGLLWRRRCQARS